jgi:DnaJ family protein C protein 13
MCVFHLVCYIDIGTVSTKLEHLFCCQMRSLWESGVLTGKTKCWAQGMDGWRTLQQVSQLKWSLMAKGTPVMNETELATLILNILIQMCQYFPSRLTS